MPISADKYGEIAGAFAAQVTVITALDASGAPCGITAPVIVELSSEPSLLLVALPQDSDTLAAVEHSRKFVVNFLKVGSEDTARRFTSAEEDRFLGLRWAASVVADGAPILREDSVAYAECVLVSTSQAGDHRLCFASVHGGEELGGTPLMHYRGDYAPWPRVDRAD